MKRPFNPDKEIVNYCEHIMNAHIQTLRKNKQGAWYWDYPAMAAICHDAACMKKRSSYCHYPRKDEFHPVLKRQLLKLGSIGQSCSKAGWRFVIGNCAEQHAANIFMKQCGENKLKNLYFSKPMRPRTKQMRPYCDNCKDTFPNL